MAVFSMTAVDILVDTIDLSGFANQLELSTQTEQLDVTTFASAGFRQFMPGLQMHQASVSGFQDYATTGVDAAIGSTLGGLSTVTVGPTGGATAGDVAYFGTSRLFTSNPLTGNVGDPAGFSIGFGGTGPLIKGQYLHPPAAETVTGSGTALAFTTPTATQTLYANFHVLSVSGAGSITFTVQTDSAVGFPSTTTRITSTAFAAVGHEQRTLAGALAGETHIRCGWTIAGFASVTFAIAAGVR